LTLLECRCTGEGTAGPDARDLDRVRTVLHVRALTSSPSMAAAAAATAAATAAGAAAAAVTGATSSSVPSLEEMGQEDATADELRHTHAALAVLSRLLVAAADPPQVRS
jgi:hypothetical protein